MTEEETPMRAIIKPLNGFILVKEYEVPAQVSKEPKTGFQLPPDFQQNDDPMIYETVVFKVVVEVPEVMPAGTPSSLCPGAIVGVPGHQGETISAPGLLTPLQVFAISQLRFVLESEPQ